MTVDQKDVDRWFSLVFVVAKQVQAWWKVKKVWVPIVVWWAKLPSPPPVERGLTNQTKIGGASGTPAIP